MARGLCISRPTEWRGKARACCEGAGSARAGGGGDPRTCHRPFRRLGAHGEVMTPNYAGGGYSHANTSLCPCPAKGWARRGKRITCAGQDAGAVVCILFTAGKQDVVGEVHARGSILWPDLNDA